MSVILPLWGVLELWPVKSKWREPAFSSGTTFSTSVTSLTLMDQICIDVKSNRETHVFRKAPYSSDVTSSDSFSHQTQLRHPYSHRVVLHCARAPCDACVTTCVLQYQSVWGNGAYFFITIFFPSPEIRTYWISIFLGLWRKLRIKCKAALLSDCTKTPRSVLPLKEAGKFSVCLAFPCCCGK